MRKVRISDLEALILVTVVLALLVALPAQAANGVPQPAHVVIVIEENHAYNEIIGSSAAPYINNLAVQGALFTKSFAIGHPSEPNYLELFSGSNQGVTNDNCPFSFSTANLGSELIARGFSFAGYSEDMPSVGYTGCSYNDYVRKHNPWVDFNSGSNAVPAADNLPFAGHWPSSNYANLPTVSIVVPNLIDDMHDGSIQQGDSWLQTNIDSYVQWARNNNSLLILTVDEDDGSQGNQVATIFVGPMVTPGQYSEHITHYNVLRTVEDMYGLSYAGASASVTPITDCWASAAPSLTEITPSAADAGGTGFTLIAKGSGFMNGSGVDWAAGGTTTALSTTYVSSSELKATVPASLIANPGTAQVTVVNTGVSSTSKKFAILLNTLKLTAATPTKNSNGTYSVTITLKNVGYKTAPSTQITKSSLGAATTTTTLPVSVGNIAAGATGSATLTYPGSAGTSGSTVTLKVSATFSGGTFSDSLKVTLP